MQNLGTSGQKLVSAHEAFSKIKWQQATIDVAYDLLAMDSRKRSAHKR